ncbi:MAG TPA: thymidine kinase, partial [Polyangia bacterium]
SGAGLVVLDEAQFVAGDVVSVLLELRAAGASVVAAGLDRDFRGLPFGPMPRLAAAADRVELLAATCARCGGRAAYSQRLVAGRPAPWEDATIRVGARELYEPRCARCFERPRRAASA